MSDPLQHPEAENAIQGYLAELKTELRDLRVDERTSVLRDAQELLRDALEEIADDELVMRSTVLAHLKARCGPPEDMASGLTEGVEITPQPTWRTGPRQVLVSLAGMFAVLVATAGIAFAVMREPPKLSPFSKVDFDDGKILVEFEGKSYEWLAVENIPVEELKKSAIEHFGSRWKKRIAEDLVEVMRAMGHRPSHSVSLRLRDADSDEIVNVAKAMMTNEKRQQVWRYRTKLEDIRLARKRAEAEKDPAAFIRRTLEERWAYYWHNPQRINEQIDDLATRLESVSELLDWPLELQKIVSQGIDGHASASRFRMPGRFLPFLIEPLGESFTAFHDDRNGFLENGFPRVTAIEGVPIETWCEKMSDLIPDGSPQYARRHALRYLRHIDYCRERIGKPNRPTVAVTLSSLNGKRSKTIEVDTTDQFPMYGAWPRTQSRLLDGNIGYLRITKMDAEASENIRHWMTRFDGTAGLIVDVRGNGGGTRDALRTFASYLLDEKEAWIANVGKHILHLDFSFAHLDARFMYPKDSPRWSESKRRAIHEFSATFEPQWEPPADRFSEWHYMVLSRLDEPGVYHYDKPVCVLMDAKCFSATDIFLGALKDRSGITLIGTASGGGSARSVVAELPGLADLRIASMASFQPNGELYDGNGIEPDIVVQQSPDFFKSGDDAVLRSAISRLK